MVLSYGLTEAVILKSLPMENQEKHQHGGRRPGSGRKRGSRNTKTQKISAKLSRDDEITPLEVMVYVMRWHYDEKRYDAAASIAKDAAPYMHARIAPSEPPAPVNVNVGVMVEVRRQQAMQVIETAFTEVVRGLPALDLIEDED